MCVFCRVNFGPEKRIKYYTYDFRRNYWTHYFTNWDFVNSTLYMCVLFCVGFPYISKITHDYVSIKV